MKHKIVTTIVVNIGVMISNNILVKMLEDVLNNANNDNVQGVLADAGTKNNDHEANNDDVQGILADAACTKNDNVHDNGTLGYNSVSKKHYLSVSDAWKHHAKLKKNKDKFLFCHLNCDHCSPGTSESILVKNDQFIHRYQTSQV
jgi:hypothetical protein